MFDLPSLPYANNSLSPFISSQTLSFHHEKHHKTYVDNLNRLLPDSPFTSLSLEDIIRQSHGNPAYQGIFNNAAQVWNHTFYWHSLTPPQSFQKPALLMPYLARDFGSYEAFLGSFKDAALSQFGSGWAWLVQVDQKLKILKTSNAETPLCDEKLIPLLTCDVWEHAYYLDYQNRRGDYVQAFLENVLNWSFAEKNTTLR